MTRPVPTARDAAASGRDPALGSEQDELISCLERVQDSFERRALSSMAEPLISTPLTMQQLKVLTMIAIDPEKDPSVRLVTLVQQRRARALLDHIDTMFTK